MPRPTGHGKVGAAPARKEKRVKELVQIEVTDGLLHVLNGCAASDLGQRVWLKLEPLSGRRARLDVNEVRFIRTWVADSIRAAEEMIADCVCGDADPDCQLVRNELSVLNEVHATLPAWPARAAKPRWTPIVGMSMGWLSAR